MQKTYYSLKNFRKEMILGPIFKMLEVVFELITPFLMKDIIDNGIIAAQNGDNYQRILIIGGIILLFCILGLCSTMVCQYYASIASQGFGTDLRNRILKKINILSVEDIDDFGKGNLINLINNDVNRLQLAVAMIVRLVIRAPALVVGSLICSFLISWKIALIYLGAIIIVSIIFYLILHFSSNKFMILQKKNDKISQTIDDGLNGSRVIKSFNAEEEEVNKYKTETDSYYKDAKKVSFINSLINPLTFLIINIAIILTILFGEKEINITNGLFTSGDIVALISYLNQILLALIVVSNLVIIFNKAFASKKRVDALLIKEPSILNNPTVGKIEVNNGESIVRFENVSFAYGNSKNKVISDISFDIKKGESVGIIGGTGSGKTTIAKLLDRYFDCSEGSIYYKGVNIKDYDLNNLHSEISYVNQKNMLFSGSVKSNMQIAKKDATDDEIFDALKKAEAFTFVNKLNNKLEYHLEEMGRNFSGGQKQRLCIARGILHNGEVIILDDSTSALDFLTDKKVRQNIDKIDGLTKIYISQRVTTLSQCDKIIVIDNGKIENIGTHEELLASSTIYKEIYNSQIRSN